MAKRSRRQRIARAAAAAPAQVAAPAPTRAPRKVVGENGAAKPVVIEMAPEEDVIVTVDYSAMTKTELQELLDAKGISYSRMAYKSSLVKLLKG